MATRSAGTLLSIALRKIAIVLSSSVISQLVWKINRYTYINYLKKTKSWLHAVVEPYYL